MAFFGFFPALFRSDWKWAIIMFLLAALTAGLSGFIFMFIYNKLYIQGLLSAGYKAKFADYGTLDQASQRLGLYIPKLNAKPSLMEDGAAETA